MKITEGYMPYLGHQTYYRIAGECTGGRKPLVCLHGGPGSTHNYFEVLDALAEDGRAIISYDQIGCGNSYLDGHPELWVPETWDNELIALREYLDLPEIHLLGQSWGGMLALEYVYNYHPEGIRSLILSSTNPSASLWAEEQHRMMKEMPPEMQEAILRAEETGDFSDPAYLAANDEFMFRHAANRVTESDPECLRRPKKSGKESYLYGWGPNEYVPSGSLKDFEYIDKMREITQPTLVVSGTDDLCTPLIAKAMFDAAPNARWELFAGAKHMCFVDDNPRYLAMMREWMEKYDA